eukprot:evm.model.scf_823.5 EVM.evm.TU.scf_823.5   scf_823:25351-26835(+)
MSLQMSVPRMAGAAGRMASRAHACPVVATARCGPARKGPARREAPSARAGILAKCEAGDDGQATSVRTAVDFVTEEDFEEVVLKSPVPVLVDFWAPWCGPCRMIAPLIDELQEEYGDKLRCVKLNTDEDPSIATEYGIRSIPTVIVFKGGKKMDTVIGAVAKSTLQSTVERFMD